MKINKYHISKRRYITDILSAIFSTFFIWIFVLEMFFSDDEENIIMTDQEAMIAIIIGVVCLVVLLVLLWMIMRRHVFYNQNKQFVVEKGLFIKRKVEIPYEHIHTISLKRNIIHMILGVTKLQVDTGAIMGVVSEADLLLNKSYAIQLKAYLEEKKDDATLVMPAPNKDQVIKKDEQVFYKAKWYQLGLIGLLQSWVPVLFVTGISITMFLAYLDSYTVMDEAFSVLGAVIGVCSVFIAAVIVTTLVYVIVYFGYELNIDGDYIEYQYGLINKVSFKLHKKRINALTLKQALGFRLFNYYALEASVIGIHATSGNNNNQSESQYFMPIVKLDKLNELLALLDYKQLIDQDIKHPQRLRKFNFIVFPMSFIVIFLGLFAATIFDEQGSSIYYSLFIILPVSLLMISFMLYYRQHGYQLYDDKLLIQQGMFTLKKTLVKNTRIQSTKYVQGPILLLERTGNIHIVFKGLARNRILQYFEKSDFETLNQKLFNL